jgi:hypothetical protein
MLTPALHGQYERIMQPAHFKMPAGPILKDQTKAIAGDRTIAQLIGCRGYCVLIIKSLKREV